MTIVTGGFSEIRAHVYSYHLHYWRDFRHVNVAPIMRDIEWNNFSEGMRCISQYYGNQHQDLAL